MKECTEYLLWLSKGHRYRLLMVVVLGMLNIGLGLYFIWVTHHEAVREYMQRVIDIR